MKKAQATTSIHAMAFTASQGVYDTVANRSLFLSPRVFSSQSTRYLRTAGRLGRDCFKLSSLQRCYYVQLILQPLYKIYCSPFPFSDYFSPFYLNLHYSLCVTAFCIVWHKGSMSRRYVQSKNEKKKVSCTRFTTIRKLNIFRMVG